MLASQHLRRPRASGFTLIELMVTIAVLAVLLGIAVPSFTRTIASTRLATQANEFMGGLKMARAEAVRRAQGVAIRADVAGSPADFATGWTVYTNQAGDGAMAGAPSDAEGRVLRVSDRLAGNTTIIRVTRSATAPFTYSSSSAADRRFVVFNGRGSSVNGAAFFRICDSRTNLPGRVVQVSVTGKVSLDNTNAVCP